MAQPILSSTGIVAGICQRVSATVAQHVRMDQGIEASALAKPFDVPVNRVRSERAAPLSREDEAGEARAARGFRRPGAGECSACRSWRPDVQ